MAFASPSAHPISMWIAQESAEVRRAVQSPGVWGELVPHLICTTLCLPRGCRECLNSVTFKMAYPSAFEGKCNLQKTRD